MTTIAVERCEPLTPSSPLFVGVGRDPLGSRVGFLADAPSAGSLEIAADGLLPLPDAWPVDDLLPTLVAWPAWRLAAAAAIELGSHAVVAGGGRLATMVLAMIVERGGILDGRGAPDAIVVLESVAGDFQARLAACRSRGTVVLADPAATLIDLNLYPDAHRRGLRIVGVDLRQPDLATWLRVRERVRRTAIRERRS
jgi:hypothetical protein